MSPPRIFVEIDVQRDLCDTDGAAYVPGAPTHVFRKLAGYAEVRGVPIVGTVDTHGWDAWEFSSSERVGPSGEKGSLPDHCMKGTLGWLKVHRTLPPRARFVPDADDVDVAPFARELAEGTGAAVYFEKEAYGLFANRLAEPFVHAFVAACGGVAELVVYGVATEGAVRATALDLARRGHRCVVLVDAIAARDEDAGTRALAELEAAGVALGRAADLFEP